MNIIVDSNFLIMMAEGLITPSHILDALLSSYRLVAPSPVFEELRRLAETHPKPSVRRAASRALLLAERLGVAVLTVNARDADDAVEKLASKLKGEGARVVVGTNDRALRSRLRRRGIPTLYYRESEGRLEVDWLPDI